MSKRLIHWAKPESFEEKSIKKAAQAVGIDEKHAAEVIDDTFKYYREVSTSDITLPDIYIGNLLSIKPNVHRITRAIKDYIHQTKAGLLSYKVLDYRVFPLWHIRRRLLNHDKLSNEEKREVTLKWKKEMPEFLEQGIEKRRQAYKDAGHVLYYYSPEKYYKYLRIKRITSWMDVKRKKLFNKKYRNGAGQQSEFDATVAQDTDGGEGKT